MAELTREGGDDRDRLRRLTARLDEAAERAERLLSASVLRAAAGSDADPDPEIDAGEDRGPERPPPAGWQRAGEQRHRDRWLDPDELDLLMAILSGVRDRIPAELRRQLADAVRELLTALRALIDWYLERAERPATGTAEVRDIPIM